MAETEAALITAFNKKNVLTLADSLSRRGQAIVSYGRTAEVITQASIAVVSPQEFLGGISLENISNMPMRAQRELLAAKLGQCLSLSPEMLKGRGWPVLGMAYINLMPVEVLGDETHAVAGVRTDTGGISLINSALNGKRDILTDPEYIPEYVTDLSQGKSVNKSLLTVRALMGLQQYDTAAYTAMTQVLARAQQ